MMSLQSRRELLAVVAPRYRAASRIERARMLDEFVASTGYHRKYALVFAPSPGDQSTCSQATAGVSPLLLCGAASPDHLLAGRQWHL